MVAHQNKFNSGINSTPVDALIQSNKAIRTLNMFLKEEQRRVQMEKQAKKTAL